LKIFLLLLFPSIASLGSWIPVARIVDWFCWDIPSLIAMIHLFFPSKLSPVLSPEHTVWLNHQVKYTIANPKTQLCGYESIALSPTISPFCHVFPKSEWLDFEYHQDIRFHYMLGYGQNLSAYLGMPWARTALHLLEGKDGEEFGLGLGLRDGESEGEDGLVEVMKGKKKGDGLPKPRVPPNATHTQL